MSLLASFFLLITKIFFYISLNLLCWIHSFYFLDSTNTVQNTQYLSLSNISLSIFSSSIYIAAKGRILFSYLLFRHVWFFVPPPHPRLHGQWHARLPCPSLSPGVCSNSCPLSQWCHPTIAFFVTPFSSCPQSFPASESLSINLHFASGHQGIRFPVSASVLPMNIQDWFPLGLTALITWLSKGFSRGFWWVIFIYMYVYIHI